MPLYTGYVLPALTHLAMRTKALRAERAGWVPLAAGVVLEIGVGSGLNIPFYSPNVRALYALEPSETLRRMARSRAERAGFPVEFLAAPAEAIPLASASVDSVVTTWTLCTITDPGRALREVQRVLRPDGLLTFVEHGRAPDPEVRRWQDRLTPIWRRIAGGCHLNRAIDRLIAGSGFAIARMEAGYIRGPRVAAYLYRGTARRGASGSNSPVSEPDGRGTGSSEARLRARSGDPTGHD